MDKQKLEAFLKGIQFNVRSIRLDNPHYKHDVRFSEIDQLISGIIKENK